MQKKKAGSLLIGPGSPPKDNDSPVHRYSEWVFLDCLQDLPVNAIIFNDIQIFVALIFFTLKCINISFKNE
jgi:hypothetical protein